MDYTWKKLGNDLDALQFEKVLGYQIPLSRRDREDGRKRDNYGVWVLPSKGLVVEADSFSKQINKANLHCEIELPQPIHSLVDGEVFDTFIRGFGEMRSGGGPCHSSKEDRGYGIDWRVESNLRGIISYIEEGPYPLRPVWGSWQDHIGLRFYDTHIWGQMGDERIPDHLHHPFTTLLRGRMVASLPAHVRVMLGEK